VVSTRPRSRSAIVLAAVGAVLAAGLGPVLLLTLAVSRPAAGTGCAGSVPAGPATTISLLGPGQGASVGATEYGGPGDPSSGTVGASGVDLSTHPDSYAELGGTSFATATAMGGLPYQTPLRITWGGHSAIAYKRDIGLGGGPVDGLPRRIDLWWQLAAALGAPYEDGLWSGAVRVERPPAAGAGDVLGQAEAVSAPLPVAGTPEAGTPTTAAPPADAPGAGAPAAPGCAAPPTGARPAPTTAGPRARLLADGQAAAPASAPAAVKGIIAAGNAIAGVPYLFGGGHGIPLDQIAPAYDCSSSVEHLLWGGGLLAADYEADSATLESYGAPGPGRWVTIYASPDHVFMYVAGLRWDTHDAAGPGDGSHGIGWHPLVRESEGFVVRHPVGL
jgi:cell wall-associated NlpC family hydrolase